MYTKQMFLDSVRHEVAVLKHLHTKLTPDMREFRPTPKQRSMQELIEFLPVNIYVFAEAFRTANFELFKTEVPRINEEARTDFAASLDREYTRLTAMVEKLTDQDLAALVKTALGNMVPLASILVDFTLKFLAAYRMQFFLYLKACGRAELGTLNVWGGIDALPKK